MGLNNWRTIETNNSMFSFFSICLRTFFCIRIILSAILFWINFYSLDGKKCVWSIFCSLLRSLEASSWRWYLTIVKSRLRVVFGFCLSICIHSGVNATATELYTSRIRRHMWILPAFDISYRHPGETQSFCLRKGYDASESCDAAQTICASSVLEGIALPCALNRYFQRPISMCTVHARPK